MVRPAPQKREGGGPCKTGPRYLLPGDDDAEVRCQQVSGSSEYYNEHGRESDGRLPGGESCLVFGGGPGDRPKWPVHEGPLGGPPPPVLATSFAL